MVWCFARATNSYASWVHRAKWREPAFGRLLRTWWPAHPVRSVRNVQRNKFLHRWAIVAFLWTTLGTPKFGPGQLLASVSAFQSPRLTKRTFDRLCGRLLGAGGLSVQPFSSSLGGAALGLALMMDGRIWRRAVWSQPPTFFSESAIWRIMDSCYVCRYFCAIPECHIRFDCFSPRISNTWMCCCFLVSRCQLSKNIDEWAGCTGIALCSVCVMRLSLQCNRHARTFFTFGSYAAVESARKLTDWCLRTL